VNWLLRYWRCVNEDFPDPVSPEFGYKHTKSGAVDFAY
jgi:hypothetical protein